MSMQTARFGTKGSFAIIVLQTDFIIYGYKCNKRQRSEVVKITIGYAFCTDGDYCLRNPEDFGYRAVL